MKLFINYTINWKAKNTKVWYKRDNNNKPHKQLRNPDWWPPYSSLYIHFLCDLLFLCHFYFTTQISMTIQINMERFSPLTSLRWDLLSISWIKFTKRTMLVMKNSAVALTLLSLIFFHKQRESHEESDRLTRYRKKVKMKQPPI